MSLDAHGVPIRRGVPRQFTFDVDAIELLVALAPSKKCMGKYLSELVRRDHIRRLDQAQMERGGQVDLIDVGGLDDE